MKPYHFLTREEQSKMPPPFIPPPIARGSSIGPAEQARRILKSYMDKGFTREEAIQLMSKGWGNPCR